MTPRSFGVWLLAAGLVGLSTLDSQAAATRASGSSLDPDTVRAWIEEFKTTPRGPFANIRWFCKDGSVQPPKAYACAKHGGGIQHGNLGDKAQRMRADGYYVGNVLASLNPEDFVGSDADMERLRQILIERFLIGWDNGWVFRGARTYRGALQIEDEEAGANAVVAAMLSDPAWRDPARFFTLREAVRLLPLQADETSAAEVRRMALVMADKDPKFMSLRAKIHNQPDAADAAAVREYARTKGQAKLAADYEQLAVAIDELYTSTGSTDALTALAPRVDPTLSKALSDAAKKLGSERSARRLATLSKVMGQIRDAFPGIQDPGIALDALQASLALETDFFVTGNEVLARIDSYSRRQRMFLLIFDIESLYGAGFVTRRHVSELTASVQRLVDLKQPSVNAYREELRVMARAPEWSGRWVEFSFGPAIHRLAPVEPEVHLYSQDRLRGSPLLFYSGVIDSLVLDANRLAGIEHELFGTKIGAGLRALNPGLGRGPLRKEGEEAREDFEAQGIYILPETTADLPAVSGILTRGEGSSLSHVQLLARNLGIPNVVVSEELLPTVQEHLGGQVVLAVSPNGVVQLSNYDERWAAVFGEEAKGEGEFLIKPDLDKLDLTGGKLMTLSELRASDSGKLSGPKGANLGELKYFFGDQVPEGFVIPFGVFRVMLDQPLDGKRGPSVFKWMVSQYDAIEAAKGDPAKQHKMVSAFLARLRAWIEKATPGAEFDRNLKAKLESQFGPDGSYGVFVRSDTNVEDLPGFTGAGLNLTVPNVVGYENIRKAIGEVWASPFTERAYGWRQAHMKDPEYVFPAIVIQRGYPSEKSGVMVTADVEQGEEGWLTVAISEGVGGAVEGQAAESLRINSSTGEIRFLAQATAPDRAELSPKGGVIHVPASGTDRVLKDAEARQLISLAAKVATWPSMIEDGVVMPADIEFAFRGGQLALLQTRPFVENEQAQTSSYLVQLDASFRARGQTAVNLKGIPQPNAPGVATGGTSE